MNNRLSLDQFKKKAEVSKEKTKELEKLTGGVLADCHVKPVDISWPSDPLPGPWTPGR